MPHKYQESENSFDVIVIGGGASGMMAAGRAAELGKKVLLLEKNRELGKKLKITGGGRCNITNAEYDERALLKNYSEAEQFLYSPFSQFGVKETFEYFEKRNLPLVVQARKRAFPHTEKALDVFKVLEKNLKINNVIIKTGSPVSKILTSPPAPLLGGEGGQRTSEVIGIQVGKEVYTANSYILATGGVSHPETGSTGDGFNWMKGLGHTVKSPTPTIVPLKVQEEWVKALSGTSISPMKITFYVDGKKKFTKTGKLLFTHFGLSGPLILNSAGQVADMLEAGAVTAKIDIFPEHDELHLEKKILKLFDDNKNKMLKNVIGELLPNGTTRVLLPLLENPKNPQNGEVKVHSVSRDTRKNIIATFKALPITITGLMGFDRAVVADGGVDLSEIDTKTMRSKKLENLFITGDLLHINRPSGGYSLQICWTTGYIAGSNA